MKILGLSKPYAVATIGAMGVVICIFGLHLTTADAWGALCLGLGSGFVASFVTVLLFDVYLGKQEAAKRAIEHLVAALHGDSLGHKNYLLAKYSNKEAICNVVIYGADLSKTEWNDLKFNKVEFLFCKFDSAILENCVFERCVFLGVSFKGTSAARCICRNCVFQDCDWTDSLWATEGFEPVAPKELNALRK